MVTNDKEKKQNSLGSSTDQSSRDQVAENMARLRQMVATNDQIFDQMEHPEATLSTEEQDHETPTPPLEEGTVSEPSVMKEQPAEEPWMVEEVDDPVFAFESEAPLEEGPTFRQEEIPLPTSLDHAPRDVDPVEDAPELSTPEESEFSSDPFTEMEPPQQARPTTAVDTVRVVRTNAKKSVAKRAAIRERKSRRIAGMIMTIVTIVLITAAFLGYRYIKSGLSPVNEEATDYIQVEIPAGATTSDIAKILEDKKLITSATVFSFYARLKSYNQFQSGFYNLKQSMSAEDLALALQQKGTDVASEPVLGQVLVVEGVTLEQIADSMTKNVQKNAQNKKTPFSKEKFLQVVSDDAFIEKMKKAYPRLLANLPDKNSGVKYRLEGYLFPATYNYTENTTEEDMAEQMIATMDSIMANYYDQIDASGKSVHEILTLASLVEKEGVRDEDRRNIASTFYNRLAINMPLQSNVALHYATGQLGKETTVAEDAGIDTNMDSPYNIYKNPGLMPGPVDAPSEAAIKATVSPNQTDYLYFVADMKSENRDIYFAKTYEEHEANVAKYVNAHLNN